MKQIIRSLPLVALLLLGRSAGAQCGAGAVQASINWDNLDFYFVATSAPYGTGGTGPSAASYVTAAQAATRRFAIGTNAMTFAVGTGITIHGESTTHTGEAGSNGTGEDVQFTTTTTGTTITWTFNSEVSNLTFSIYDLDANQKVTVNATDASSAAQTVSMTKANALAPFSFNPLTGIGTSVRAEGTATDQSLTSDLGTVNVFISGPVKTVTFTTSNATGNFFISDITACVTGSFPANWHGNAAVKPFTGQPDYFISTPDNNSFYAINPANGNAHFLFTDAANTYVNSLAYDWVNKILYYVTDGSSGTNARNNKALKKYDFNTETITTLMADMATTLNMPMFEQGVESGAAAFYNGCLYFGVEGGRFSTSTTRESIIYRIDFDASLNPMSASQVLALNAYNTSTGNSLHDWGDFLVMDGNIIDFNTARQGSSPFTYPSSSFIHYNMQTGAIVNTYLNPTPSTAYVGQGAFGWNGTLYSLRNTVQTYNGAGGLGAPITIASVGSGPAWVGSSGDGSEPFRPRMDFGDAPTSYDPASGDPAVHELNTNLRLGSAIDREWDKRGSTSLANSDVDDGLAYVPIFNPAYSNYLAEVSVFNNTGAAATMCAWLDANGNGTFEASEGITVNVPTSASQQNIYLYWPSIATTVTNGTYTYLRVRIASAGLTTAAPRGYLGTGEVEDYRVFVNSYPLNTQNVSFEARAAAGGTVDLKWNNAGSEVIGYAVERSSDRKEWTLATGTATRSAAAFLQQDAVSGNAPVYYRLRMQKKDGTTAFSSIRKVQLLHLRFGLSPNPAALTTTLMVETASRGIAEIRIINAIGAIVHTQSEEVSNGSARIPVSLEGLRPGRYVVEMRQGSQRVAESLIIKP